MSSHQVEYGEDISVRTRVDNRMVQISVTMIPRKGRHPEIDPKWKLLRRLVDQHLDDAIREASGVPMWRDPMREAVSKYVEVPGQQWELDQAVLRSESPVSSDARAAARAQAHWRLTGLMRYVGKHVVVKTKRR